MTSEPAETALAPRIGLMALVLVPVIVLSAATHLDREVGFTLAWTAYMVAFAGWGAALWLWAKKKVELRLRDALILGAIMRLCLLPSEPLFSDDIWRYVWDGKVQGAGINPYQYAPADAALTFLRDGVWAQINHREVPTIYPPVSQLVFAFSALFDAGLVPLRLVMSMCEFLALGAAWRLAERGGAAVTRRRVGLTLLILWNPLMAVEFVGSGHLDALAIAPLMWALALVVPRPIAEGVDEAPLGVRPWLLAGLALGLSIGAKLLGLVVLPVMLAWACWVRRWPERDGRPPGSLKRCAALLLGLGLSIGASSAPYGTTVVFDEPGSFTEGLGTYVRKWRANDGLFGVMVATERALLSHAPGAHEGPDRPWWRFDALDKPFVALGITQVHEGREIASTTFTRSEVELSLTKLLVASLLGLLLLLLLHQRAGPSWSALALLAALFLMAPTVHPWYVAWLVPLAAVHRCRSMLLWSALVVLAYVAVYLEITQGRWYEPVWVRCLEYFPVFFVLIMDLVRRMNTDHAAKP